MSRPHYATKTSMGLGRPFVCSECGMSCNKVYQTDPRGFSQVCDVCIDRPAPKKETVTEEYPAEPS